MFFARIDRGYHIIHSRLNLLKSNIYVDIKQYPSLKVGVANYIFGKNLKILRKFSQHNKQQVMSFHLRPRLLKLVENLLKYFTLGIS